MLEPAKCRLCGALAVALGGGYRIALHRCSRCGFVSGFPPNSGSPEERYAGYHAGPAPTDPQLRYEQWLREAEARVGCGRLLEVGAGRGGFVRSALSRGWEVHATEMSSRGLESLRATGASIVAGDVSEARFPDGHFDLVVSLEVLEHLPEPARHLEELRRVTRSGGLLLLTTPNFAGLSRRWLGPRWRVVAPEHLGYFEPRSLSAAVRSAGYGWVRVRARSLDVTAWKVPSTDEAPRFDPQASARLRDTVESRWPLRAAKEAVNALLGLTGLGDSLLAWAGR